MTSISIDKVQPDEVPALAEIGTKTFRQTFAHSNDPADFVAYLAKAFCLEQLSLELANPESGFWFARIDGELAGYLKVNRGSAQTEVVDGKTLEIERIYVDADLHGTGVGKALFQHALAEAREMGAEAVWLGVWEENAKAIEFYSRQGFTAFGEHKFVIGNDPQRDILMRCEMEAAA